MQGEPEDGNQAGHAAPESGNKGLAQASTDPRKARLRISKTEGGGFCRWLLLAWVPQVFPAAQTESSFLVGQDRWQPEEGSIGERSAAQVGVEGYPYKGVSAETLRPSGC